MKPTKTTFGNFNLYTIETGVFKLDGGAMFGVVPKTLWSRYIDCDDKNRISMTVRCLLVESTVTGKTYLIDNGVGTKFDEKMSAIYQLDDTEHSLLTSLQAHGFSPDDITDIIFTHLHFDHCGGTTTFDSDGALTHVFPKATYHVNKRHWETAVHPNAREKASFLPENIEPLKATNRLHLVDDNHAFEEGFETTVVNGHTIGQQLPVLTNGEETLVFVADLLPTHVHVPLPWVMGYDMYPTETLLEKERFLKQAASGKWHLYLEHDADIELIQISFDEGRAGVSKKYRLNEL